MIVGKSLKRVGVAATLVASLPLLYYGLWIRQFHQANEAFQRGDYQQAKGYHHDAEVMLDRFQFLKHLPKLKEDYQRLVLNQVKILYAEGRYDEVLKNLEESLKKAKYLDFSSEFHFWAGNALFRQAIFKQEEKKVLEGMQLAMGEYQRGLELAPEDWDLKYNYELTKKMITEKIDKDKRPIELLEEIRRHMKEEKRTPPAEKAG